MTLLSTIPILTKSIFRKYIITLLNGLLFIIKRFFRSMAVRGRRGPTLLRWLFYEERSMKSEPMI